MDQMENIPILTTHSTSKGTLVDDLGQPWHFYSQYEEVPEGVRFNVRKLDKGMIQYEIKGKDGRVNTFIAHDDNKCLYEMNFRSSGMPAIFKGKGMASFNASLYQEKQLSEEIAKKARGYIKHFEELAGEGMGLFIYSPSEGSGKTHLVCAIANEIMGRYKSSIKFVRAVNFFSEMKRSISQDKSDPYIKSHLFESAIQSHILVIDDLGAGTQSAYVSDLIYELISKRVQQNKVTLFTSKRSFKELAYDTSTLILIQQKSLNFPLPNENVARQLIKEKTSKYDRLLES